MSYNWDKNPFGDDEEAARVALALVQLAVFLLAFVLLATVTYASAV
jgi:hypothetical protein